MIGKLKRLFSPPVFEDEHKNYTAKILNVVILMLIFATIGGAISNRNDPAASLRLIIATVIFAGALWLLHRGYLTFLSWFIPLIVFGLITFISYTGNGVHDLSLLAYALVIASGALLLGARAPLAFTLLTIIAVVGVVYAEVNGLIVTPFSDRTNYGDAIAMTITFLMLGVLLQVMISNLTNALTRARANEQDLVETNQRLRAFQATLEERIESRTQGLELVATVLEHLNLLDLNQFLFRLVNQVKDHFDYYHVQVYLVDDAAQELVRTAGAGAVGEQMNAQNYRLSLNDPNNPIARAANRHITVSIDDIQEIVDWSPDPLLPETRSLMAVPIVLDGRVAGILEVQEDEEAGFDTSEINVLQTLANQVAVALRNARLFEQVETALAEAKALQEQYLQTAWETGKSRQKSYHYHRPGAPSLDEAAQAQLDQAINSDETASLNPADGIQATSGTFALTAPIRVQNQVIGTMRFFEADPARRWQWNEREVALVQAIADQVAQTAENLRLLEETRQQAGREQVIREVTDKLRVAPTLDLLLETATRELAQRLNVPHTVMELGIETENSGLTAALAENNR